MANPFEAASRGSRIGGLLMQKDIEEQKDYRDRQNIGQLLDQYSDPNNPMGYNKTINTLLSSVRNPQLRQNAIAGLQAQEEQKQSALKKQNIKNALISKGLNPAYADLDPSIAKDLIDMDMANNMFGGGFNPNASNQSQIPNGNNQFSNVMQNQPNVQNQNTIQSPFDLSTVPDANLNQMLINKYTKPIAEKEIQRRENEKKNAIEARKQSIKDTEKYRTKIADNASYARKTIQNKKQQMELINKGDINNPLVLWATDKLPGAIQNKLLSTDTQLYKSGLFEEFGVLKQMFPGQIRVKEIELLEDKLATLDKSDEAKKKILEVGIQKAKEDIIMQKAAAKVEKEFPDLPLLQFQEKVDEYAQPEKDKLYEDLTKEYNDIFYEYAPEKLTFVLSDGSEWDIPKDKMKKFVEAKENQGFTIKVKK